MPMVNCLVGWKSLAQAALFQLDFSGCWSRISSCTGRADFSAALCVTVLPGRCRWCLVRTSTAVLPKRTTRPTGLQASQCTMCVWAFLGNRCMFSVLGSAPETPSGWCVGIVGTAPPGTEEVSSCPGFALSGASCYSQHCHWPLPQFNWSSEAIQTSFSQLGIMEQSTWVRFEEEEEVTVETSRRTSRTKNISTSSSLSSSLSSVGSTSMERRMADFTAALDVEQFSAHLNDKYAVLQDLHATTDNLGWSSLVLNGTQDEAIGQRQ